MARVTRDIEYTTEHFGRLTQKGVNRYSLSLFTIYTKDANCKRGDYAEELDIEAETEGIARRIAEQELAKNYDEGLKVSRISWRGRV